MLTFRQLRQRLGQVGAYGAPSDPGGTGTTSTDVPGAGELRTMCESAQAVSSLCELLRIGRGGPIPAGEDLEVLGGPRLGELELEFPVDENGFLLPP